MSRRPYDLPPFAGLSAFEAAARHLSFKTAARELNVTPGAISHQIKALESDLGVALFERQHRGVALTEAGHRLFVALRQSFDSMSGAIRSIRVRGAQIGVTVAATTAVSALWLTPAVSRLWREAPSLRVNQIVSDTLDFGASRPELVISYGPFDHPGYEGTALFTDHLVPVCAPSFLDSRPATLAELHALFPIHLDAPDRRWTTWARWFADQGISDPVRRGIRVNNYMIALQAAQDGVGVVLGWHRLVRPLLESGALVALEQFRTPAPAPFVLSRLRASAGRSDVDRLREWLLDAGVGPGEPSSSQGENL